MWIRSMPDALFSPFSSAPPQPLVAVSTNARAVPPSLPQEAVSTGVLRAMESRDYACSTYRDHVHALSKGVAAREVMAELFGKKTGCCRGQVGREGVGSRGRAQNTFMLPLRAR